MVERSWRVLLGVKYYDTGFLPLAFTEAVVCYFGRRGDLLADTSRLRT